MSVTYTGVFELFKIGLGPSSSHTVGPMLAARRFAASAPSRVKVRLFGSLALTGPGHGTGRAIVLGLQGHHPETVPIDLAQTALETARASRSVVVAGRHIDFDPDVDIERIEELHPTHPNVICFESPEETLWMASVGGGFVAEVVDGRLSPPPPSPTVPYPFTTAAEVLEHCRSTGMDIHELVMENERATQTALQIRDRIDTVVNTMYACIDRGLSEGSGTLPGPLGVHRRASGLAAQLGRTGAGLHLPASGPTDWAGVYAIAVNEENAAGTRVVTAPTNGAAGIIPAVLRYMDEFCVAPTASPHEVFLLTAAAIGSLIKQGAGISGAELGCQGEVGTACAMAAAGLTAALGGTPQQTENAAEIALEHNLGLTCDPVGGLVQVPCIERNAIGAVKAITAASLALRGSGQHVVSLDAAIRTLRETGSDMDSKYKETSLGGLAVSVPAC